MKLTSFLIGLVVMTVSSQAATILFGGGGSLGASHTYGAVTATGYLSNGVTGTLFGKGSAGSGSEDGLGLTADPTGDNELFAKLATGAPANDFIQLDISGLSGVIQISMGSTGGDTWAVFGSNSSGTLGGTMLASGGNNDGAEVTVMNATNWHFLDVRAVTNNVLLQDLIYTGTATATPEPGTLSLLGTGGLVIGLMRRKLIRS